MTDEKTTWLREITKQCDSAQISLCDALDAKANVILVAAVFAATLAEFLFTASTGLSWFPFLPLLSVAALIVAAVFAFKVIKVRKYILPHTPRNTREWYEKTISSVTPPHSHEEMLDAYFESIEDRIDVNFAFNKDKSKNLGRFFRWTLAAFVIQAIALLVMGVNKI